MSFRHYEFKTMQTYDQTIPILPSRSIAATVDFYQRLGFKGGAHDHDKDYAILTKGSIELHFFKHPTLVPEDSYAGCYVRVVNVERIYQDFLASQLPQTGIPRVDPLENKPWGLREFAVLDLDGNLLRIGQIND